MSNRFTSKPFMAFVLAEYIFHSFLLFLNKYFKYVSMLLGTTYSVVRWVTRCFLFMYII